MDDAAQCPLGGAQTHANFQASCRRTARLRVAGIHSKALPARLLNQLVLLARRGRICLSVSPMAQVEMAERVTAASSFAVAGSTNCRLHPGKAQTFPERANRIF